MCVCMFPMFSICVPDLSESLVVSFAHCFFNVSHMCVCDFQSFLCVLRMCFPSDVVCFRIFSKLFQKCLLSS
jgi:hypothetical protein